jgi:hypothetical protein
LTCIPDGKSHLWLEPFVQLFSMSPFTCDISSQSLAVNGQLVICGGVNVPDHTSVIINGTRQQDASAITIQNSDIHIILDGVFLSGLLVGLIIAHSDARIEVENESHVLENHHDRAGIGCDGGSNLTIFSSWHSVLHLAGGPHAPGIGTVGTCGSVRFLNGSYISHGGDGGPGFGVGPTSSEAILGELVFESGEFIANAGAYSAGIGTGFASNGSSSSVGRISIMGGSFVSRAGDRYSPAGCGLGSGNSFG